MDTRTLDVVAARSSRTVLGRVLHGLAAAAVAALTGTAANAQVSQTPLYLGGGNVPGNLLLVPSVEWPTIHSVANLGAYSEVTTYVGYFDAGKCYTYTNNGSEPHDTVFPTTNPLQVFEPSTTTANHRCTGASEWSGNFMNWAATQTIDPFRSALTGGYRVKDTSTVTWLEKARYDGTNGTDDIFPNRRIPATSTNTTLVDGATPLPWTSVSMRIHNLGNKMYFTQTGDVENPGTNLVRYAGGTLIAAKVYWVNIRVRVCASAALRESNCKQYTGVLKPEGLIQQYSDKLRIGVFGFLNDSSGPPGRDGGVLRAKQKFVGPTKIVPGAGEQTNLNKEWNTTTGELITNPDSADATATNTAFGITVTNSGAINYLNKFGQMTTGTHKTFDPVGELYYAALRYLKHQGNVPAYTNGATAAMADGFPVITSWDDPIQYACQKNVILGIGDVNTWRDKNLPGNTTYNSEEPGKPAQVTADTTVNVVTATNKVGALEGLGAIANNNSWSGRENSAYMAGLAYMANATDLRPTSDLPGKQTVSTHWVDVLEAETLKGPSANQYYLAAKYGGLKIPKDVTFNPATYSGTIPLSWWHTNGQTLTPFVGTTLGSPTFKRPDNYYLAGGASQMVSSLTQAFAQIAIEVRSSASSVAANSTRVDSDTAVFQAAFNSAGWSGELNAFTIHKDTGEIGATATWNAAAKLDALTPTQITNRKIFSVTPPTVATGGSLLSTTGIDFLWAQLSTAQKDDLRRTVGNGTPVDATVGDARLEFLRGSTVNELPSGTLRFRDRDSRLGDIINSDPQFVHTQNFGYTLLAQSAAFAATTVGSSYATFRASSAYLNRTPMVIVGANDGMLHGFDASLSGSGGAELFAFVPDGVYDNLYELTLDAYQHRYYVDSTPRVADVWTSGTGWRTLVVGTTGAGGRSVFALDVTNPAAMSKTKVLWEFTHPSMGFTRGQPSVVPLPNGGFGVVVTSGYETGVADGRIWILDPANGSIIHTIVVPASGDLGPPLVVDLNSDRVADRIYVGDTKGNLWRFDLTGSTPSGWTAPAGLIAAGKAVPLFKARDVEGDPQAITAQLTSAFNQHGAHMVFFGTGSFYLINDNVVPADPVVDSFYGVIDRGVPITSRANMTEQEILIETKVGDMGARGVTNNEMEAGDVGWYIDLEWKTANNGPGPKGERVVARPLIRGDRVIFATLIPDPDPCKYGGNSWIMELDPFTGSRLSYSVFDLKLDGAFDAGDYVTLLDKNGKPLLGADGKEIKVPVSGLNPDIGITQAPAIVGIDEDDIKVVSGSSGQLIKFGERGGVGIGRQSWRELR